MKMSFVLNKNTQSSFFWRIVEQILNKITVNRKNTVKQIDNIDNVIYLTVKLVYNYENNQKIPKRGFV